MKTTRHLLLIVVLSAVLFLAACGQGETSVPPTATKEVVVKPSDTPEQPTPVPPTETPVPSQAVLQAPVGKDILLDPANAGNADSLLLCGQLYEGLVKLDASGAVVPAVAASWTISDDKLDYIFNLNPNEVFSDGTPLTADAVVENFNRWFVPASSLRFGKAYDAWLQTFGGFNGEKNDDGTPKSFFDGIEKVDNFTVMIHLNKVNEDLLNLLAQPAFAIVNPAVILAGGENFGTLLTTGEGTGPYKLGEWKDTSIILYPNDSNAAAGTDALEYPFK